MRDLNSSQNLGKNVMHASPADFQFFNSLKWVSVERLWKINVLFDVDNSLDSLSQEKLTFSLIIYKS